ncbi:BZ3500_MvSof-1268-A1-R1_Chr3-3g06525 [Microbotryum saponariae]|uniref:Protein YIP n=1 Tax=Microbotryum saponariae TaxID=289078 RepID=A0A2X0LP75_9BASI|nr:BZ3500_MvSof-1268-A1-R1_Chr3-3g06525 [Microbotryum saponariae]SDA04492.1 BZ3501_MvSof-1269-A2-R1_Chr3-2g06212 [Microbotryum saponariae]
MSSHQSYTIAADSDDEGDDLVAHSSANLHNHTSGHSEGLLPLPATTPSSNKGKGRAASLSPDPNALSGRIGSSPGGVGERTTRSTVGGVKTETRSVTGRVQTWSGVQTGGGEGGLTESLAPNRYTGQDTLDEPVSETIMRDLRAIGTKIVQVLHPTSENAVLKDWDLWGPLMATEFDDMLPSQFCLSLAILLSTNAPSEQSLAIFTGVFVIVWLGSVVVTLNAKLLGGKVSFFQSLCVLGYCVFPIDIAAIVSVFIKVLWIRLPICLAAFGWSIWAAVNFLGGTRLEKDRAVLAIYPLVLLFFLLAWMVMLS